MALSGEVLICMISTHLSLQLEPTLLLAFLFTHAQIGTPTEKATQLIQMIIDGVNNLCSNYSCGLSANQFTESAFQCFSQNAHEVTFRTRLHETSQAGITELIDAILDWVDGGAVVNVGGVLLTLDPECTIIIESITEEECTGIVQQPLTTAGSDTNTTTLGKTYNIIKKRLR